MRNLLSLLMLVVLAACAGTSSQSDAGQSSQAPLSDRSAADIERDSGRQPEAVLDFLGVEAGMRVMDIFASSGYYTEVLANRVGPSGVVYAQNPAAMLRFRNGAADRALAQRLFGGRLPNVRRLDREFDDLGLVAHSLDAAITALNFHDIYNNSPEAADAVLGALFTALKPGGVVGIIDHEGNAGGHNKELHRMPGSLAVAAAEKAGFTVESSDLLANPEDDHTQNPFVPDLRGNTDRFLLKLTKPG